MLVEDQHDPRKGSNCANPTSCTSNPEGLGEIAKRVLHEVQRAVAEGHCYSTQH